MVHVLDDELELGCPVTLDHQSCDLTLRHWFAGSSSFLPTHLLESRPRCSFRRPTLRYEHMLESWGAGAKIPCVWSDPRCILGAPGGFTVAVLRVRCLRAPDMWADPEDTNVRLVVAWPHKGGFVAGVGRDRCGRAPPPDVEPHGKHFSGT